MKFFEIEMNEMTAATFKNGTQRTMVMVTNKGEKITVEPGKTYKGKVIAYYNL